MRSKWGRIGETGRRGERAKGHMVLFQPPPPLQQERRDEKFKMTDQTTFFGLAESLSFGQCQTVRCCLVSGAVGTQDERQRGRNPHIILQCDEQK